MDGVLKLNTVFFEEKRDKRLQLYLVNLMLKILKYKNVQIDNDLFFIANNVIIKKGEEEKKLKKNRVIKDLEKYIFKNENIFFEDEELLKYIFFKFLKLPNSTYLKLEEELGRNKTFLHVQEDKENSIIYLKSEKYEKIEFYIDKVSKYVDIPFEKFMLYFNINNRKKSEFSNFISVAVEVVKITKKNLDTVFNEFFQKNKFSAEKYDEFYNDVFYRNQHFYILKAKFSKIFSESAEVNFFLKSGDYVTKYNTETEKFIFAQTYFRMKYLTQIFEKKFVDKDIQIEFTKKVPKNKWKVKNRRSCIVKSHLRHLQSGKVSIVKSYFRGGINSKENKIYMEF